MVGLAFAAGLPLQTAVNLSLSMYEIYVDGSEHLGRVGYGWVVLHEGREVMRGAGGVPPEQVDGTRQVAGELMAVGHALRWCQRQGIDSARIYYDYLGVEKWATGSWQAKKPLTQRYAAFMREQPVRVQFVKVKSHSGDKWNDVVDVLAREAAQKAEVDSKPTARLDRLAPHWIERLMKNGFEDVKYLGLFNQMFARFEVMKEGKRAALFDLYDTKAKPLSPYVHTCKDERLKQKLLTLWALARPEFERY